MHGSVEWFREVDKKGKHRKVPELMPKCTEVTEASEDKQAGIQWEWISGSLKGTFSGGFKMIWAECKLFLLSSYLLL